MKKFNALFFVSILTCIVSCSSSDGNDDSENNKVSGTIQLSGPDTSTIGTTLVVGNIETDALATTGTENSVILLDENTTIEDDELVPTNFSNLFVIATSEFNDEDPTNAQKAISMTIVSGGTEFRYGCLTPSNSSGFIDCGTGLVVDKEKKEVVFEETTVENTDSGAILTMNGRITWE